MQEKTTQNYKADESNNVRAEELIVNIYKCKSDLQDRGIRARKIIMPMFLYKKIKAYHARLGEIQSDFSDYITDDEIFGIPVYIDGIDHIRVE